MAPQQSRDPRTDAGALLGEQLASARKQAGFDSQGKFATRLGVDRTVVAKFESGERIPNDLALNDWLDACEVTGLTRDILKGLCRLAHTKENPGLARTVPYYETEARAHTLRYWSPLLVPGPAQTADYARALFVAWRHDQDTVERLLKDRMERQSVLGTDGPDVTIIIWEPMLDNLIGSPQVMHGQIARLLELSDLRTVHIHVHPANTGANMGLNGAINLASTEAEEVLMVEGFSESFVTSEHAQVFAAASRFNTIRSDALNRIDSRAVLTEAMERWNIRMSAGVSPATAGMPDPATASS